MLKPDTYTAETKSKLWPVHMRNGIENGAMEPLYVVNKPDYDRLPLYTYLIATQLGTGGLVPDYVVKIVKPNNPRRYPPAKRTSDGRLLYVSWAHGNAVKQLCDVKRESYRHVVMPGEDGYELLQAFKIACDTRRAWSTGRIEMPATILHRALKIEEKRAELGLT